MESKSHYYPDGDIIIIVNSTIFKVHKIILKLTSTVFNDMFTDIKPDNDQNIPKITLENESDSAFEDLLSFIYPTNYFVIDWTNIIEIFRISDKFMINFCFDAAENFLENNFSKDPVLALYLSEKYELKELFKKASKLVLDNFYIHRESPDFIKLNIKTRLALIEKHHDYLTVLYVNKNIYIEGKTYQEFFDENSSTAYKSIYQEGNIIIGNEIRKSQLCYDGCKNFFIELN
ncbi:BTB/POZ domain-containing protein [Glomus cerebriforme]|uniref:BTB/POZ domain-containing protein n=1 Tax=Glomus cerebriforme TaxID=658196 RepID=A0A397SNK4_9GLOM|nr:BTB/POZ domain-containing protein [Glomus cerebriforme]